MAIVTLAITPIIPPTLSVFSPSNLKVIAIIHVLLLRMLVVVVSLLKVLVAVVSLLKVLVAVISLMGVVVAVVSLLGELSTSKFSLHNT